MAINIQKFERWIKRHPLFAASLPILLILLVFFVTTSLKSMATKDLKTSKSGYNNNLPNQENELEVKQPNTLYKQSIKDSLESLRKNGPIRNIVDTKKENDSLERILEELDNFSLDETESNNGGTAQLVPNTQAAPPEYVSKKTAAQEKLDYRKLLMEARDERLSRSQDYSAPYTATVTESSANSITFDAAIYRDQFILPGNRVTLILKGDVHYNGKLYPKNTFVYAVSNIQGSRVLLEVSNINNVPLPLKAIDLEDGMVGLHNERAGELLSEFEDDVQQQGVNELSEAVGDVVEMPLGKNLVRSFGNFFQKKKYNQRDKILLVNGDRVSLVPKI